MYLALLVSHIRMLLSHFSRNIKKRTGLFGS
jgi:hypothetical protein